MTNMLLTDNATCSFNPGESDRGKKGRAGHAEYNSLDEEEGEISGYGPLVGRSPAMCQLYRMIARTAPTEATVLLIGESGTGKELIARMLHERSGRRPHPYIPLNCGAIPENLIEAELFGHDKGAFTGANQVRRGVFEQAHRGTLLLDEITEMPADMQVRLLRVLETGEVTRIGSEQVMRLDVRIVAATNRPVEEAVRIGKLREDLLYRLAVVPLHVPPLRQRKEDIDPLIDHLLDALNQHHGLVKRITPDARQRLHQHTWPGNVRQLRNVLERAFIMSDNVIDADALIHSSEPILSAATDLDNGVRIKIGTSLADAERQLLAATLQHCRGDKRTAARTLGISLKTLYNRLNSYKAQGFPMQL